MKAIHFTLNWTQYKTGICFLTSRMLRISPSQIYRPSTYIVPRPDETFRDTRPLRSVRPVEYVQLRQLIRTSAPATCLPCPPTTSIVIIWYPYVKEQNVKFRSKVIPIVKTRLITTADTICIFRFKDEIVKVVYIVLSIQTVAK